MSVYGQVPRDNATEQRTSTNDSGEEKMEEGEEGGNEREQQRLRAQEQAREMVLLRNRQRHQVAVHLQAPVPQNRNMTMEQSSKVTRTPQRVTRRSARRHNNTRQKSARARQNLGVRKCSFVAGRRRC